MRIKTEPNLRGRRLKAYKLGYEQGMKNAPVADALCWRDRVRRLEQLTDDLQRLVDEGERKLQFANDRIEQLTNSVVIIRDEK